MMKYDGWTKRPHGTVDEGRLKAFEEELGGALPDDFKHWLEAVNGGKPDDTCVVISDEFGFSGMHHIYGFHKGPDYAQLDRTNDTGNINEGLVAFADDPGGNKFTVSVRPEDFGAVIFWDHETADEYVLSRDFPGFLELLRNEEEFIPRDELEKILRADDPEWLARWLEGKDIDIKDEYDRSPIESAAIYRGIKCIEYLHALGAKPFESLRWARQNLKYFPKHQATVDLLERLYPEK